MQLLRLLDNDVVNPEELEDVKEALDDYLTRNQDDFDDFEAPDDLYADLVDQLDNLEVHFVDIFDMLLLVGVFVQQNAGRI